MKIRLLSRSDSALEVWNISRPLDNESNHNKIHNLDLPVSEFMRFDLEVTSSIFVRELFCTLRDHVVWAQTSRVQDVTKFKMNPFISDTDYFCDLRNWMVEQKDKGERQDSYRLELPLFSLTTYSISISLRSLANVAQNLMIIAQECCNGDVASSIWDDFHCIMNFLKGYSFSDHKAKEILNRSKVLGGSGKVGGFVVVTSSIPLHLRAQLVRHRQLLVRDNLFELVTSTTADKLTISDMCMMQISGSIDFLHEIASKRSCWIAQYDIWSDLLSELDEYVKPSLPCKGGSCPFEKDVELRVEELDPNSPCPKYLLMKDVKTDESTIERMKKQLIDEKRPSFWMDNIIQLEEKL